MADKIQIASTFEGTVSFIDYGCLDNDKKTPYVEYRCKDAESGREAYGKLFCSEKALPYTIKKLKGLGVEGDDDRAVLAKATDILDMKCTFDTEENDGYINANDVRAQGTTASGGGVNSMDKTTFLDGVFGADAAAPSADAGAKKTEGAEAPPF